MDEPSLSILLETTEMHDKKRRKETRVAAKEKKEENPGRIMIIFVHRHQGRREGQPWKLLPEARGGALPLFLFYFLNVLLAGLIKL
ncbi:uncharacterized protein DS421_15g522710 [Arachis hypogaea]|nr:uncharacterized protein DS421_15g522710 [Arachis hypogaea]